MYLFFFVFVAGYKRFFPEWGGTHSRPEQPANRSVSGSPRAHPTTNGGKWITFEKWVTGVQSVNLTNVFLEKLIACTFLPISPSKPKKKKKANHLGCVVPVRTPTGAAAESVIANSLPAPCCPNGNSGCSWLQFANQWSIIWRWSQFCFGDKKKVKLLPVWIMLPERKPDICYCCYLGQPAEHKWKFN